MKDTFRRFTHSAADAAGSAAAFLVAAAIVIVWAASGPLFAFSDTWQLVINTSTTIVTFLMVFLIQNTQNRDSRAFHAKLDELIVHVVGARDRLLIAEELPDDQLDRLESEFEHLANRPSGDGKRKRPVTSPTSNDERR